MLEHLEKTSETWLPKWSKVNKHLQIDVKNELWIVFTYYKNNVRNLWNEMLTWHINYFVDELQKLVDMGYGKLVTKDELKKDKILPSNQCCNVYMKPEMTFMDPNFFLMVMDSELKDTTYVANFNKDMDDNTKRIVNKYHPHKDFILMSQLQQNWKHVSL